MITIAIPFYNAEKYLHLSIESVISQTYLRWKLILIDDGSTDNSLKIAVKYQNIDKRIRVLSDGHNKNLGYRLNQIASIVKTKYLARMDADDIMHPDRIKTQLEILESNPQIDVLGSNVFSINENNMIQGIRINSDLNRPELISCKTFIHPTIIAQTSWFKNNPYDVKAVRIEDFELWARTYKKSEFAIFTYPLLYYREYGDRYYLKYLRSVPSYFHLYSKNKSVRMILSGLIVLLKSFIYWISFIFRVEDKLINKRTKKLDNVEIYQRELNSFLHISE